MDLLAIRKALADTVAKATGICYPHPILSPATPCAWVELGSGQFIDYLQAFGRGQVEINLRVVLLASPAADEGTSQISIWLSTGSEGSVADLLAGPSADKTLGGVCTDLVVRRAENADWFQIPPSANGTWFASAEIAVDIYLPQ